MLKGLISRKKEKKHVLYQIAGIKVRVKHPIDKQLAKNFLKHTVPEKTVLIIEINDCHKETIPGYYKLLKELGYNAEILIQYGSDGLFSVLPKDTVVWECNNSTFAHIIQKANFKKYHCLLFNSKRIYCKKNDTAVEGIDVSEYLKKIPEGKNKNIYVQHHINKINEYNPESQIILANPAKEELLEANIVNPNYFGDVSITPKNAGLVRFITVGELSSLRRNSGLLLEAVEDLHNKGVRNFKVTVIGSGNLDRINPKIQHYFNILGRVDFPLMFKSLEEADYFLPLLDPELKAHKRYMDSGTSGSFQLIYGFLKPCIIHKTFADIYGFDTSNALIYEDNSKISKKMHEAINVSDESYLSIQNNLKTGVERINNLSLSNLNRILNKGLKQNDEH